MIESVLRISEMADEKFDGQKNTLFFKSIRHGYVHGYVYAMNPREEQIMELKHENNKRLEIIEHLFKENLIIGWTAIGESYTAFDVQGKWENFMNEKNLMPYRYE